MWRECSTLLVLSCLYRLTATAEVTLSTCDPQLANESLSLCCRTRNFPPSSKVVFRKLDDEKQATFITSVTAHCQTSPSNNNQGARFRVTCSRDAGWDIYRLSFAEVIKSEDLGLWWCGYYDGGFYGTSSTFSLEASKIFASHRYLRVDQGEQTMLSWQLKDNSSNTTLLDPRSNTILRLSGKHATFLLPRYTWKTDPLSDDVSISWNTTAREDSGTYVIESDVKDHVVREGITLVVPGLPKEPIIQSVEFGFDVNHTDDFMILSCTSESTSAAPLFYEPDMTYKWLVGPKNAISASQKGDNLYIHALDCKSNLSILIYCEASEGGMKRNNSQPFEPLHSWFCNSDSIQMAPPPQPENKSDKGDGIIVNLGLSIGLIISVVLAVVLGRRRIVRRLRGCRDNDVCCCSITANILLCSCSTVESEDTDLSQLIEAQRRSDEAARRRRLDSDSSLFPGLRETHNTPRPLSEEDIGIQVAVERAVFDNLAMNMSADPGGASSSAAASSSSSSVRDTRSREHVDRLLRQHNTHLKQEVVNLEVYRDNIVNNLIAYYATDPDLAISSVHVSMVGEEGYDCGGVSEDMFTTFWNKVWEDELFVGNEVVVPHLHKHKMSEKHIFLTLGRILSHTVAVTKSFPIPLSRCAIICMVFNTYEVDREAVLRDFLYFLDTEDRHIVMKAIGDFGSLSPEDNDTLQGIFARFEYGAILKEHTLKEHLHNLANDVICSKPRPLLDEMRNGIPPAHFEHFWSVLDIDSLGTIFRVLEPSPERVIGRIVTDMPEVHLGERQKKALDMLRKFIGELTKQELETLLHFITGSKSMPRTMITVMFTTQSGLLRSPKAHTCSNVLELPETYDSYDTFRSEMKNLLASDEAFVMNMQ